MYELILKALSKIFGLTIEVNVIERSKNIEYLPHKTTKDKIYQIYATNYKKGVKGFYFGFYEYCDNLNEALKKTLKKLINKLIYLYKRKAKKWIKNEN